MSAKPKRRHENSAPAEGWTRPPTPDEVAAIRTRAVEIEPRLAEPDSELWDEDLTLRDEVGNEARNRRRDACRETWTMVLSALGVPAYYRGAVAPPLPPLVFPRGFFGSAGL